MRLWLVPLVLGSAGCLAIAGLDGDYSVGSMSGSGGATVAGTGGAGTPASSSTSASGGSGEGGGMAGAGGTTGPTCGNSIPEPPEECDDGNTNSLDGCSDTCTIEDPDSCAQAPLIVLNATQTVVVSGDTSGAADDVTASIQSPECGAGTRYGPDDVWAVLPQANGTLTVSLAASYDYHYLQVFTDCPGTMGLNCDYGTAASTIDDFTVDVQMGTTYYVFVDSWSQTSGPYTLTVTLE